VLLRASETIRGAGRVKSFLSDNTCEAGAPILEELRNANHGDAAPYGADEWTRDLQRHCADFFESTVRVFPVHSGTAANAIALSACVRSDETAFCHRHAHAYAAECGAFEMFSGGARLTPLDTANAKLVPRVIREELQQFHSKGGKELVPRAVSVSQATEFGTLYSPDELAAIGETCGTNRLLLHMDGARFFYALAALGCSAADMTWRSGVSLLSLGTTKCGGLDADAIVMFDSVVGASGADTEQLAAAISRQRRRSGHAGPKMRFASAQISATLSSGLARKNALHGNELARSLEEIFKACHGVKICQPVQTNHVIVRMTDAVAAGLREKGWEFLDWTIAGALARRFVTGPSTDKATLAAFAQDLAAAT
jgi:threonine aldolase